jgi:hypothetical protein
MKQAEMPSHEVAVATRTFQAIADDLTTFQETKEYLLSQKPQTEEEISARECDLASIENDIARLSHELLAKTDSFTAVVRRLETEAALCNQEVARYRARQASIENARVNLKAYALRVMQDQDIQSIKTPLTTLRRQKNGGVCAIEIDNLENLPDHFCDATVTMNYSVWKEMFRLWCEQDGTSGVARVERTPSHSAIRAELADACPFCGGKGCVHPDGTIINAMYFTEGSQTVVCQPCQGDGRGRVRGVRLMPRGEHLRIT